VQSQQLGLSLTITLAEHSRRVPRLNVRFSSNLTLSGSHNLVRLVPQTEFGCMLTLGRLKRLQFNCTETLSTLPVNAKGT
jgi:hypothetical protein